MENSHSRISNLMPGSFALVFTTALITLTACSSGSSGSSEPTLGEAQPVYNSEVQITASVPERITQNGTIPTSDLSLSLEVSYPGAGSGPDSTTDTVDVSMDQRDSAGNALGTATLPAGQILEITSVWSVDGLPLASSIDTIPALIEVETQSVLLNGEWNFNTHDTDTDGFSNLDELDFGSDPNDSTSSASQTALVQVNGFWKLAGAFLIDPEDEVVLSIVDGQMTKIDYRGDSVNLGEHCSISEQLDVAEVLFDVVLDANGTSMTANRVVAELTNQEFPLWTYELQINAVGNNLFVRDHTVNGVSEEGWWLESAPPPPTTEPCTSG